MIEGRALFRFAPLGRGPFVLNRLFELELGPVALATVASSSPEDHRMMNRIIAEGAPFRPAFFEAKGMRDVAEHLRHDER